MRIHLEILLSTRFFSSKELMVTGKVAELEAVPKAVTMAFPMLEMNLCEVVTVAGGGRAPERKSSGDETEDEGQHDTAVDEEPEADGEEVETKLGKLTSNILDTMTF